MGYTPRREFLKRAAAGLAGAALVRSAAAATFDVKAHGAKGDGTTLDTGAINKAIDAAAAAGGGTVVFPAGNFLSYSIRLKSNVTLQLDPGATLIAADAPKQGESDGYDMYEPNKWDAFEDFGHSHFHNSLIWGEHLENIGIVGSGKIWGKGLSRGQGAQVPGVGNKSIALRECHNVILRDFSIFHGGHFGILATGADNMTIDNLKIDTNRDGMDINSCRNVRVSNCFVNSPWDDGICLKADYATGGARVCEFVTITNCYVSGCWEEGTLLDGTYKKFGPDQRIPHTGRIKFGTESNGGFRNITISNCVFEGCQGLALETVDGALLEDVTVTGISMRDIVSAPIFMRLGSRLRGPDGTKVGTLRRVIISDLVCSNASHRQGSIISGIPGFAIEDVKIANVLITHEGGGTKEDAAFRPPEYEDGYPEPTMFTANAPPRNGRSGNGQFVPEGAPAARGGAAGGRAPTAGAAPGVAGGRAPGAAGQGGRGNPGPQHSMPSQGFYVRHVKGIQFDNIEIRTLTPDARPAFVLEDVQDADFFRVRVPHADGVPTFALKNVSGFGVHMCSGVKDTEIEKAESRVL